jgi:DNA-binding response OmpR family regulator
MNSTLRPILLVEDDPNDILLIRRAFEQANVAAPLQIVHDGEAVLAYLAGEGAYADRARYPLPILILLDLKLPQKSGFEVLTWMRRQGMASPPVVALTSSGEPTDILRGYELGACSFYVKPASSQARLELVRVLLRDFPELRGRAGDRSPAPSAP